MNTINSFTIYREYYDLITLLSDKEQANVLLAMVKYVFEDEAIKLSDRENKVFVNLKRPLEKSKIKSQNANKTKSNSNQNKNETKTKQHQNEIKSNSKRHTQHVVNVSSYDNNYVVNGNVNVIYEFIEDNFSRTLSPVEINFIDKWLSLFEEDIIKYAVEIAVFNNKKNFKYVDGILKNWKSCNYTTLQEIKDNEIKRKDKKGEKVELFDYDWLNDSEDYENK